MKPEEALDALAGPEGIARARELLSSALRLDAMIALKLARLDALKARAEKARIVPGLSEETEQGLLEQEILEEYRALMARQRRIQALLSRMPDERQRTVLELRYLQGLPFFRIAMQLHYDERQIYRYHRAGLRYLAVLTALESPPEGPEKTD